MTDKLKVIAAASTKQAEPNEYEIRIAEWLQRHGSHAFYGIIGAILLFIILFFLGSYRSEKREHNFLTARIVASKLADPAIGDDPKAAAVATQELVSLIQGHSDLTNRYQGVLTQDLLWLDQVDLAREFGNAALKELSAEQLNFYAEFSKISLLIAEKKLAEATAHAVFLQKKMQEAALNKGTSSTDRGYGDRLLVWNAIRIASLYGQAFDSERELLAWEAVTNLAGSSGNQELALVTDQALQQTLALFKAGQVGLQDYIQHRKQKLRE